MKTVSADAVLLSYCRLRPSAEKVKIDLLYSSYRVTMPHIDQRVALLKSAENSAQCNTTLISGCFAVSSLLVLVEAVYLYSSN